jgi:glutamine---fructose-6-phosphate transaminase (isomerizing)
MSSPAGPTRSFREGVLAQPENLRDAAAAMHEALDEADLAPLKEGTVVLCGIGASWHALLPAVRALRRAGRRAFAVTSVELEAARDAADAYVLISQSGASTEMLAALETLQDAPVYSVSAKPDSPLPHAAGRWLPLGPRADTPVSTLSYTATLQALGMLAERIAPGIPAGDWATVADLADESLQRHGADADLLAAQLAAAATLDVIASSPSLASAGETALLGREALHLPAAHEETRQYLHGPLESVGAGFCCLLFGAERELELAAALAGYGAAACAITDLDGPAPFGVHTIRISPVPELAAPILQILPVQLAVAKAAETLGLPVRELTRQQPDTKIAAR